MLRATVCLGSLLLLSTIATAQTQAPAPSQTPAASQAPVRVEAADGKSLFRNKTCIACHGREGSRAIQNYPEIAGQDAKYLLAQMNDIADGKRLAGPDARGYPRTQGMKDIMHLVNVEGNCPRPSRARSIPRRRPSRSLRARTPIPKAAASPAMVWTD